MKKIISLMALCSLMLTACGASSEADEKQRFIDATVEVTCMIFESEDLLDPSLEQKTKDIFAENGFDVEDEAAMEAIAGKYEDDPDVQSAVEEALAECAGDLMEAFEGMEESMGEAMEEGMEETMEEGEEVAEEEATEEPTEEASEEEASEEEASEEETTEETSE